MPPASDDRAWIEKLVFGRENARRFTQDSPVLPDVWIAFAKEPEKPQPLLLTPNMDPASPGGATTPGMLRKSLAERLPEERKRDGAWCRKETGKPPHVDLAHNQATVLATLWFDELVRVVLPMSTWWIDRVHPSGFDQVLGKLDLNQEGLLAKMLDNPDLSATELGIPANAKPSPDLLWTVRVGGTIALSHLDPTAFKRMRAAKRLTLADYLRIANSADEMFKDVVLPEYGKCPLVYNVGLNRPARTTVERSRQAVKADAVRRVFDTSCATLTWAVIDSGVDASHPAFRQRDATTNLPFTDPFKSGNKTRVRGTFDFNYVQHLLSTAPGADANLPNWLQKRLKADAGLRKQLKDFRAGLDSGAEVDWARLTTFVEIPHDDGYQPPKHEHGTHVAGIIAADWDVPKPDAPGAGQSPPSGGLHGICPDIQLYDLRVLDDQGAGDEFNIISALQYIRFLNSKQDFMAAHGVNLSLSLQHDVANYACGRTPVCLECERLVSTGVIVVAAAGNRGFQKYMVSGEEVLESYHSISITDPGNADSVITVGATHRTQPHAYGVSYFSSRGPTGDGRAKPDLVAPGEKIESAVPGGSYKRMDGTSMAAPHVSGVAALLLSRYRELIGQPRRIKELLCKTATDLGREPFFQGHGMIDALRALQSV